MKLPAIKQKKLAVKQVVTAKLKATVKLKATAKLKLIVRPRLSAKAKLNNLLRIPGIRPRMKLL